MHCQELISLKVLIVWPGLVTRMAEQRGLLPDDVEIIVPGKGTDEELSELVEDVEIIFVIGGEIVAQPQRRFNL